MITAAVTRRYAQALHEEAGDGSAVRTDLRLMADVLRESRELVRCLESPVVPRDKKRAVLERLFQGRVQATTLRFLHLVIERRREALLPAIVRHAQDLQDAADGTLRVQARVYDSLPEDSRRDLEHTLSNRLGRRVEVHVTQDDALLGGMVVRVGDTVYDGSVRHQLARLRTRLHAHA